MNVSRRSFLKTLGIGTFSIFSGVGLSDLITPTTPKTPEDWVIDSATQTIKCVNQDAHYTVLELHRWLQDLCDDASMMDIPHITTRSTDTIINLENGWTIEDDSFQYLYDGSITDRTNGDIWVGVETIGAIAAGSRVAVVQNETAPVNGVTEVEDGHINCLIKTRENHEFIDEGKLIVRARGAHIRPSEFIIHQAGLGKNIAPVFTSVDNYSTEEALHKCLVDGKDFRYIEQENNVAKAIQYHKRKLDI